MWVAMPELRHMVWAQRRQYQEHWRQEDDTEGRRKSAYSWPAPGADSRSRPSRSLPEGGARERLRLQQ